MAYLLAAAAVCSMGVGARPCVPWASWPAGHYWATARAATAKLGSGGLRQLPSVKVGRAPGRTRGGAIGLDRTLGEVAHSELQEVGFGAQIAYLLHGPGS